MVNITFEKDGNQWLARLTDHPQNGGPHQISGFGDTAVKALEDLLIQPEAENEEELMELGEALR